MVFEFKEPIDTALEYHVWQAKLTVSGNGRVATMTSMPYNMGLKAGDIYTIVMVISGAAKVGFKLFIQNSKIQFFGKKVLNLQKTSLPDYKVSWTQGEYEDMSCLIENNSDDIEVQTTPPPTEQPETLPPVTVAEEADPKERC